MAKTQLAKEIGLRFQVARKRLGLTQQEIADKIGVSRTTVANWERGERTFEFDDLVKILPVLDVTPNYFLGLGESGDPAQYMYDSVSDYGISGVEQLAHLSPQTRANVVATVNQLLQRSFSSLQAAILKEVITTVLSMDMNTLAEAYIQDQLDSVASRLSDKVRKSVDPDGTIKFPPDVQAALDAEYEKITAILVDAGYDAGRANAEESFYPESDKVDIGEIPEKGDYESAFDAGFSERSGELKRSTGDWDD